MKTNSAKAAFAALAILFAFPAFSASLVCSGTVAELWYHQPGAVMVKLSSMNTAVVVCDLNTDWLVPGSLSGTTTPGVCKLIYGALLAANRSGAVVQSMIFDADTLPASCNSFAFFAKTNLRFFSVPEG